jgi:hypothetical protein
VVELQYNYVGLAAVDARMFPEVLGKLISAFVCNPLTAFHPDRAEAILRRLVVRGVALLLARLAPGVATVPLPPVYGKVIKRFRLTALTALLRVHSPSIPARGTTMLLDAPRD